jgi:hypothetical protein
VNSGCEEMQLEYGYVWIYFSLFISPSTQAVPCNHAEYQQSFSLSVYNGFHIFSPYLFLYGYHGFCFGFQNTEINVVNHQFISNKYNRLFWPNLYLGPRDSDIERER